ncbi:MAG: ArsR/SmtB family transcription factor [Planctomycetaceae bacterium]
MRSTGAHHQEDSLQSKECAQRLKALGDPIRLKIVNLLSQSEMCVGDLAQFMELEVVTVSHHLQVLKHSGLVTPRREGKFIYYALTVPVQTVRGQRTRIIDLGCCSIQAPAKAEE